MSSGTLVVSTVNSGASSPLVLQSNSTTALTLDTSQNATFAGTAVMSSSFKRNRIINGNMQVAQRGTSFSSPANISYTLDRWFVAWIGAAPATVAQVAGPTGYQNALQITGSASNTQTYISQRIESVNIADLASTTVTLSATISASTSQTILWAAFYPNAVDNYTSFTSIATGTWSATTTATRFSAQIALPSSAANGLWISFYPQNAAAFTSGTVTITGVQVEAGTIATPYERQIYSDQLAQCQRYYYRQSGSTGNTGYSRFGLGLISATSTLAQAVIIFPVTMRTYASAIDYASIACYDGNAVSSATATIDAASAYSLEVALTTSGMIAYHPAMLIGNNTTAAYFGVSAEL